ncbi:MAG: imidazoleglycerol-phosphate dehydratase HisB [Gemmataceae bacterium]
MGRQARLSRQTAETAVELELDLDGTGQAVIGTGIGFFDHMLHHLARHALWDMRLAVTGDIHVDAHHTVEDTGLVLGRAVHQALGDKSGIRRFGHAVLPMDDALVTAAVDLSGRPCFVWRIDIARQKLGAFDSELAQEFWRAVACAGMFNLHVLGHYGHNVHHQIEAVFKAVAQALRVACERDPRCTSIPSTKGTLAG